MLRLMMTTVLACGLFGCMADTGGEGAVSYDQSAVRNQLLCGGIAGLQCPDGMRCLIKEDYPDAAGTCVGGGGGRTEPDCSAVRCMAPVCQDGFEPVYKPNSCCDYVCRRGDSATEDGSCATIADCEGLPHIMCVGSWSCDAGFCAYSCDSEPVL